MALLTAKVIAICLALATTAFMVSTIVLAVQKAELEDELQDTLNKLDAISTVPTTPSTTPTTPTTPTTRTTPTTAAPNNPTQATASPGNPTDPNNPTSVPTPASTQSTRTTQGIAWPTMSTEVTPVTSNPNYPSLPTGLPDPEEIIYRLPTDIKPVKYRLYWHPKYETNFCEGTVTIQIEVYVPTNLIVLHAKDLEIGSITILNVMAYMRIRVKSFSLRPERELLIIELEELLRMSTPYVVNIDFTCKLTGLNGMYSSVYKDENNDER